MVADTTERYRNNKDEIASVIGLFPFLIQTPPPLWIRPCENRKNENDQSYLNLKQENDRSKNRMKADVAFFPQDRWENWNRPQVRCCFGQPIYISFLNCKMRENFFIMLILFTLLQIAEYMLWHSRSHGMRTGNKRTRQKAVPSIAIPEWFPNNAPLVFQCEPATLKLNPSSAGDWHLTSYRMAVHY